MNTKEGTMAWPHTHSDTDEIAHLASECQQLAQRLADCRLENRQLCDEIGRLRKENHRLDDRLTHEIAVRFGKPAMT